MSFRINNNISAMSVLNVLNENTSALNTSLLRLSTGKRINSAADDPSGLIQVEGFKAQISGIEQAITNNTNAQNFGNTADGALNSINDLLTSARSLAVANGDSTLSTSERAANSRSLKDIIKSIDRITNQTTFGGKKLLDGSAGVNAVVTNSAKLSGINFNGTFAGTSVTSGGTVDVNVTTAATQATSTGNVTYTATSDAVAAAGSFTLNGKTFTFGATDTVANVMDQINKSSGETGVTAVWDGTSHMKLTSVGYGSDSKIDLTDSAGIINNASVHATGTDSVATVTYHPTTGSAQTATFNKGTGLTLEDSDGNTIQLTEAGNATGAVANVADVTANSSTFQIGGNVGQTASLSIGNYATSNLGTTAVTGKNLSTMSIDSTANASDALKIIDAAISQVTIGRGDIGSFIKNTLQANSSALTQTKTNLTSSMSAIEDVDQAAEMTNYSKLQVLSQSALSMLSQANSMPQMVLNLMKG